MGDFVRRKHFLLIHAAHNRRVNPILLFDSHPALAPASASQNINLITESLQKIYMFQPILIAIFTSGSDTIQAYNVFQYD